MALIKCKDCKQMISTDAQVCPKCGADKTKTIDLDNFYDEETRNATGCLIIFLLVIASMVFTYLISEPDKSTTTSSYQTKDAEEQMATMLNLNGLLCAKITSIRPLVLDKKYEVTCIEYRGGSATVTYIYNGKTGKAFRQ